MPSGSSGSSNAAGGRGTGANPGRIPGRNYAPLGAQVDPARLAQRVERAERGTGGSSACGSGASGSGACGSDACGQLDAGAVAFAAFSRVSDEMDELFVGKDSPLLQMRSDETPFEQLPSVPPERLLPELLRFVRSSLATEFRWVTNLTDLAIALHLQPFMSLVRPTFLGGGVAALYPPCLPLSYRLSLWGGPLPVPWPELRSGHALLACKAVLAARWYQGNEHQGAYWVAERALRALDDTATADAIQAELAAAGVPDPAAALTDLRYACHETCVWQLCTCWRVQEAEGEEARAAVGRHAGALLRARPDLGMAWTLASMGHFSSADYFRAQVTALKGIPVVDAQSDAFYGASLRNALAGSMALAGEAGTPGRLRVGVLRRLIGEATLLSHCCRSWVPKGEVSQARQPAAIARHFFGSRDGEQRIDALPNDAVEPCFNGMQRHMLLAMPSLAMEERCGGCKESIERDAQICVRCRGVAYHNRECQRVHWRAGHRHQCQDVESGGLDWAAELEKAEAGLAAWEQGGGDGATNEQRLVMAQLGALAELGGALTNDDLSGAMMGLQLAGQLPGGAEGGLPPGLGDCVLS